MNMFQERAAGPGSVIVVVVIVVVVVVVVVVVDKEIAASKNAEECMDHVKHHL